jgi:hypothetical protein
VIATVQALYMRLADEDLTARQIADELGTLQKDNGAGSDLVVRPNGPGLEEARVMRKHEGDEPAFVELTFVTPVELADLEQAFGEYHELPLRHGQSGPSVAFDLEKPGKPFRWTLLANAQSDGTVQRLTLRRDSNSED